jgi:hypothetical protein
MAGDPQPRRIRFYLASRAAFERGLRVANAAFTGAWLGWMDRAMLAELDRAYYATQAEPVHGRALPYADAGHIRSGLFDWERRALEAHFPAGGRIVVTGAGAGRELHGALALGLDPVGFEPNEAMVAAGRALLTDPEALRPCERDRFPAVQGAVDGIVVGWTSYTHIPHASRRIAFLRGARSVVGPGTPVLLSFWMQPPRTGYLRAVRKVASAVRRLRRGEPVELGDTLSPLFVHCFSRDELVAECAAAGFEVVELNPEPYPHAVARAV